MIRPILGQPAFSIVMLTIGIGYVVRGLITMLPVPHKDQIWSLAGPVLNEGQGAVACR